MFLNQRKVEPPLTTNLHTEQTRHGTPGAKGHERHRPCPFRGRQGPHSECHRAIGERCGPSSEHSRASIEYRIQPRASLRGLRQASPGKKSAATVAAQIAIGAHRHSPYATILAVSIAGGHTDSKRSIFLLGREITWSSQTGKNGYNWASGATMGGRTVK